MKATGIASSWTCFACAIAELIVSYNRNSKGVVHPARIAQRSDTGIVVECDQGTGPKGPLSRLMVTIKADKAQKRASIDVYIQRWERHVPGAPHTGFAFSWSASWRRLGSPALTPSRRPIAYSLE